MARLLPSARLVITGEGSLDAQTLRGKAPAGVAAAARASRGAGDRRGRPGPARPATELAAAGIVAAFALTDLEPDPDRCMRDAAPLLERTGERIAQAIARSPSPLRT